jgi:hypothetical protein
MKNKLLTLAGALALLAAFGHFYAKPLLAQVRAALVQGVDEPGRHPYQVHMTLSSSSLVIEFPAVPSGHRLVLQQVDVSTAVNNAGDQWGAFTLALNSTLGVHLFDSQMALDSITGIELVSARLTAYVDSGQHVTAYFNHSPPNAPNADITLIGHLIDCSAAGSCTAIVQ